MVKSRDFVSLRSWYLCRDGKVIPGVDMNTETNTDLATVEEEENFSDDSDDECILSSSKISKSRSEQKLLDSSVEERSFETLSKSLNAKAFFDSTSADADDEPIFSDAMSDHQNVYVSAAVSIDYPNMPPTTKYIRGENKVSCCAMRELSGQKDHCIFEWLLCLDLKGYIPKYVLDTVSRWKMC
jgi:hypothetical protein